MPVYEYKREDGSIFEINQKMSESPLTVCPTTGQSVKRLISGGSGVIYKGDGWYVTDYKDKPKESVKTSNSDNAKVE
jgi:putative FmdB family regulatory protein